jgi:hypothetical protein
VFAENQVWSREEKEERLEEEEMRGFLSHPTQAKLSSNEQRQAPSSFSLPFYFSFGLWAVDSLEAFPFALPSTAPQQIVNEIPTLPKD